MPVPGDDRFAAASLAAVKEEAARFKAMAVGPGLGRVADTQKFVRTLLAEDVPLMLDADGLYALGDRPELLAGAQAPTVLTPHEGELARLLGLPADEVAARRLEWRAARAPSAATPP